MNDEIEIECEVCEGMGTVYCPAKYINGDLYFDAEILECEKCNGTGKAKVTKQQAEEYEE